MTGDTEPGACATALADPAPEAGSVAYAAEGPAASPSAERAAWAVSAALLAFAVCMSVLPPALVRIQPEMGLNTARVSQLSAFLFGPFLATIAAASYLVRRYLKGALTTAGCLFMLAGSVVCTFAGSYAPLCAGAALLGIGGGLIELSSSALIGELFDGHQRRAAMNYSHVAFAAGSIGTPLAIAAILRAGLDWRLGFWGAAVLSAASGIWMAWSGTHRLGSPPIARERIGAALDAFCLLLSGAMFFYAAAEVGVCYWLPTYFITVLESPEAFAAAANGIFWTGMIAGRLVAGSLGRRFSDAQVLLVTSPAAAASAAVFLLLRSPEAGMVAAGLTGLTFAAIWPTIVSYAGHVYASRLTFVFPIIIGAGAVGATTGPVALGALSASLGHHTAFVLVPVCCALIAGLVIAAPQMERRARAAKEDCHV